MDKLRAWRVIAMLLCRESLFLNQFGSIFRVLLNLAWNAIQAMSMSGEITVTANWGGAGVIIEFSDDGPGLLEKARAHLFEAFTGSARSGGTRLGLAIARELALTHGGYLTLLSSDTRGNVFRIDPPGQPQ